MNKVKPILRMLLVVLLFLLTSSAASAESPGDADLESEAASMPTATPWMISFQDPVLADLIEQGLENNPDPPGVCAGLQGRAQAGR